MRKILAAALLAPFCLFAVFAQAPKDVRAAAKPGVSAIPTVAQYLNSASVDTRVEVVKQLVNIGGKETIDPLIQATRDNDPEVQARAIDALVNYYLPGYVKTGPASTLVRAGASVKAKFSDSNDQIIEPFVIVRPEVITAIGALARGSGDLSVRATACRAVGILRGQQAVPDLLEALKTKDNTVMYEALAAMEKIRDPAAGPRIVYLLRDLDDRVQTTAIETVGLLRTKEALSTLRSLLMSPRNTKVERAALAALATMPEAQDHDLLRREMGSKDDKIRESAAEGLGRLGDPADVPELQHVWDDEEKMLPRLGASFALVMEGKTDLAERGPFRYLINTLNSVAYREVAAAYLIEAARRPAVLKALYGPLDGATSDEKIYLARILAASGDQSSIPYLDKISRDPDQNTAQEGLRALRSLRARLGVF